MSAFCVPAPCGATGTEPSARPRKPLLVPKEFTLQGEEMTAKKCHNEIKLDDEEADIFLENDMVREGISEEQRSIIQ